MRAHSRLRYRSRAIRVVVGVLVLTVITAIGFPQEIPERAPGEYPEALPRRSARVSDEAPQRSLVLGGWHVSPTYMDTGAFAAAEEHAYWTPTGPQRVVVTVWSHCISGCESAPSVVRLETDRGRFYNPLGPDGKEHKGALPDTEGASAMIFKVAPNENPTFLVVENPNPRDTSCGPGCFPHGAPLGMYRVAPSPNCPDGCDPDWRKLGTGQVALSLAGLASRADVANVRQRSSPVRLGQLEIRVTSVGLATREWSGVIPEACEHGHHVVQISFAIKNVSEHPNCTSLYTANARIFDNHRYEYSPSFRGGFPYELLQLLPGETIGASISFDVWDGTAPRLLTIMRDVSWERGCAGSQHRPVDMHGGSVVRIPITGVPVYPAPSSGRR